MNPQPRFSSTTARSMATERAAISSGLTMSPAKVKPAFVARI